jgi:cytochrome P450
MDVNQLITLILAAGGALAATIGVLFKTVMSMHKDHRDMLREHGDMKQKIGKLQGEKAGIERLAADVIETVHKVLGRHRGTNDEYVAKYRNNTSEEELRRKLNL